ncbi:P-loop containing nucleoside triphosphate hydrolase protein [Entophlyctis helioformis]|nr:P-loop containing nucleoside triphosphate hydrolase protein [Entophlyctis helioformis]
MLARRFSRQCRTVLAASSPSLSLSSSSSSLSCLPTAAPRLAHACAGEHLLIRTRLSSRTGSATFTSSSHSRPASIVADPSPATQTDLSPFVDLGASEQVAKTLAKLFDAVTPSDAQRALLPAILSHKHVILKDVTGSGKTLGLVASILSKPHPSVFRLRGTSRPFEFTTALQTPRIPDDLIQAAQASSTSLLSGQAGSLLEPAAQANSPAISLLMRKHRYLSTLVIVPTRDLAVQIATWMRDFVDDAGITSSSEPEAAVFQCVVSGVDIHRQTELLQQVTPRILIGTPARLLELYEKRLLDVSRLQLLVVDEIDRIVDIQKRYETVKSKFNRHTHPLAGETLMKRIIAERRGIQASMKDREIKLSPTAAGAAAAEAASSRHERQNAKTAPSYKNGKGSRQALDTAKAAGAFRPAEAGKGATDKMRFDPAQSRPLQIVVASATANHALKIHLTKRNDWLQGAVMLDMNNMEQAPASLRHQAYVVDKFGNAHHVAMAGDAETAGNDADGLPSKPQPPELIDTAEFLPKESASQFSDHGADDVYESEEEERLAMESLVLADDHDHMVRALAALIHKDGVERAFVFGSSSISMTRLVDRLQALDIRADKLINLVDYTRSTVGTNATDESLAATPAANGAPAAESTKSAEVSLGVDEQAVAETPKRQFPSPGLRPFERFIKGEVKVVCATEYEARGLDLPLATHVYILGMPSSSQNYLHMAGRASRFGRNGTVVTLLGGLKHWKRMTDMVKLLGVKLQ